MNPKERGLSVRYVNLSLVTTGKVKNVYVVNVMIIERRADDD